MGLRMCMRTCPIAATFTLVGDDAVLGAVARSKASTPLTFAYAPVGACPASCSARSTWRSSLLLPAGGGAGPQVEGGVYLTTRAASC